MVLVSATHLRARPGKWFPFLRDSMRIARQARGSPGYVGGALLKDRVRRYWTVTMWEDEASMVRFVHSGVHDEVMPRIGDYAELFMSVRWRQEEAELPDWATCHWRLSTAGTVRPQGRLRPAALEPPRSTRLTLRYRPKP